jgi:peptidyl-prolyl cis-trans isomerase A (cyclophilin A)
MLDLSSRWAGLGLLGASFLVAHNGQNPVQATAPHSQTTPALPPGLYAYIVSSMGQIVCRLLPSQSPNTVANFQGLVTGTKGWTDPRDGKQKHSPFYTGLAFHRVIKNFMIQGGDPLGTGEGGPGFAIDDEISPDLHFDKPGMLAMAKRSNPNSAGSQFFITTAPAPWLEGKYSIFGEVVEGQDVVDKISELPTDENDKPQTPVLIRRITIRKLNSASANAAKP